MAQQSSRRLFGTAPVDSRWDNLVRSAVKELTLVLVIVMLCMFVGGASLRTASLLGVTEWTVSQSSAAGADSRVLDRDGVGPANDDGYLEGLQKALGL
jgi:hypothetical protein